MQRFYSDLLWVGGTVVAGLIGWGLVRHGATPNEPATVEQALRLAQPADLESITVYPLVPGPGAQPARPFQVQAPAQLRAVLPALRQLRPLVLSPSVGQPLLDATVVVRLAAAPAAAWHLHNRAITFRLASSPVGEVAQLAQTNYFYQAAALHRELARLRDSLPHR